MNELSRSIFVLFSFVVICKSAVSTNVDIDLSQPSTTPYGKMTYDGVTINGQLGYSVSRAGDINHDGFDDMIMSSPYGAESGTVYVLFGNTAVSSGNTILSNISASAGFRIMGAGAGDRVGTSVGAAGDVNGDGIDDIIIGAPYADPPSGTDAGISYIIFGRNISSAGVTPFGTIYLTTGATAMSPSIGFRILGAAAIDLSGTSVNSAGDVNGDGVDDVIIGAREASPQGRSKAGISYVIFGRSLAAQVTNPFGDVQLTTGATALSFSVGFRILGASQGDFSGKSVSSAGDVNGDGVDDVIVGAYLADPLSGSGAGISYVIFGRSLATQVANPFGDVSLTTGAISLPVDIGFRILGAAASDFSGWSVSKAGDVNNDGIGDVLVGAYMADISTTTNGVGISYVIFGRNVPGGATPFGDIQLTTGATHMSASIGFRILGAVVFDYNGYCVRAAGDFNKDGIDDIIIGAAQADLINSMPSKTNAGISYVIFGRSSVAQIAKPFGDIWLNNTMDLSVGFCILGAAGSDQSGYSVSGVGDFNGDGTDDVAVGAPFADPANGADAGRVYVLFGNPLYPTSQPSSQPSVQPSNRPSKQPSGQPSTQPSVQPTRQPSSQPSRQPTHQPSRQPSSQPSCQPNSQPTKQPSCQPTNRPSGQPSSQPLGQPTGQPSGQPSNEPSSQPTARPSAQSSTQPSSRPSGQPSASPSQQLTSQPSAAPSNQPTSLPSTRPSADPTCQPSSVPSSRPSCRPSEQPSVQPTSEPSGQPTDSPTAVPTAQPSIQPATSPSSAPTARPSAQPSESPSEQPTSQPSSRPSAQPSSSPTLIPSAQPAAQPTSQPSSVPNSAPSYQPTSSPSAKPSSQPTSDPSEQPSSQPSTNPSSKPTSKPSGQPSTAPTPKPSPEPTPRPTLRPTRSPTPSPTRKPSVAPTESPTVMSSIMPTVLPGRTQNPSRAPTAAPSLSEAAQWRLKLAEILATAPAAEAVSVVHRSSYYELDVASASPSTSLYGSCSGWQSLLNGDVSNSRLLYQPVSIQMTAQESLRAGVVPSLVHCNDTVVVNALLEALSGNTSSTTGEMRSYQCGSHMWSVGKCAGATSAPSLCVDCEDPCSAALHCTSSLASPSVLSNPSPYSIAPCVTTMCPGDSLLVSAVRRLVVSYADLIPAPTFLSRTVQATRTSFDVAIELSAPGSVYCAAYVLDPQTGVIPAPTSTSSVMLQNFVNSTGTSNSTVVTISGLQSATDFLVYCLTASRSGSVQALSDVLSQPLSPSTTCCIPVQVQTSSLSVRSGQVSSGFLTMTVNARPSIDLIVSVTVRDSAGAVVLPAPIFPAAFRVNALSTSTATFGMRSTVVATSQQTRVQTVTMTSSLLALPVGNYTYTVSLAGESFDQYSTSYAQASQTFSVNPDAVPLAAPELTSASFVEDGSYVAISFDSNTDKGRTSTQFTCSALFTFACASTSTCVWTSSKVVSAYVSSAVGCAAVNSPLSLLSTATVKAQCPTTSATCNTASWPRASTAVTVLITAPTAAVSPVVAISAPSTIGACDSLTLDISGSSGNGGRPWLSRSIQVQTAATANVSDLQHFLTHKYQASPPTAIPAALLSKGFAYNFVVTLCNFLGKCSQSSKSVLPLDRTLPTVSLPGAALRTTTRSSVLTIDSDAYIVRCGSSVQVRSGLSYSWTISTGGAVLFSATSISKDPSKFMLAPYTLQVGTTYDVTLVATITATAQSASATVQVFVEQGDVVAVVALGTSRTVRAGESLTIDASGSFDEDQVGVSGHRAGLVYSWSCAQVQPVYVQNCSAVFAETSDGQNRPVYSALARANTEGVVVQVSMFLLDAALARSAESVITVTVLPSLSPVVTVSSNAPSTGIFNRNRELQLTGVIDMPSDFNGTAVWSVDDATNFDLDTAASSPLLVRFAPPYAFTSNTIYLALRANTLPGRSTLTFSLTTDSAVSGLQTVNKVAVVVNAPPLAGSFTVAPPNGTEIVDTFSFLAEQWFDSDLPLLYQFAYVSSSEVEVVVRSKLQTAFGASTLPAGLSAQNFSVTCLVTVFDFYAASESLALPVVVRKLESRSGLETLITANLAAVSSSRDGLKQATSLGSYLLNEVECSAAPDCAALNRHACYRTANTCGECLSSTYVGDSGDSNTACVEITPGFSPATAFRACDNSGQCLPELKTCASNCSFPQGSCIFVHADTGVEVPSCYVGATDCNAVCDCTESFIGSDTCSLNSTQLLEKQALRSQVIRGIQKLVSLEDADRDTVTGWIGSVESAAQTPDELSEEGITSLLDTVETVIRSSVQSRVSPTVLGGVLRSLDASVQAKANKHRALLRRRRLLGTVVSDRAHTARLLEASSASLNSTLARTEEILSLYRSVVSNSLLPGQEAVTVVLPQFRVSVQTLALIDTSSAASLTVPRSALERVSGQPASSVSLPAGLNQGSLNVSLTTLRSELLNTELFLSGSQQVFSNPLTLELSEVTCPSNTTACRFGMVLQTSAAMAEQQEAASSLVTFNTTCKDKDPSVHSYVCPDGSILTAACPGFPSTVVSRCLVTSYTPTCNSLTGLDVTSSGCEVLSFTATSITCSCPLQVFAEAARLARRKLQGTDDDAASGTDSEVSVSYAAMLSEVKDNFEQTVLSAQGLDADSVEDGWSAIVTVGCIAAVALLGLSWAHQADAEAAKVKPQGVSEKDKSQKSFISSSVESMRKLFPSSGRSKKNRSISSKTTKWCLNKDVQIAEQALPAIMSSTSLTNRVKEEIKNRHKWFGIVFYFSPNFPRVLRVLSLVTNVIIMLFIQSITYSLTNPDDGLCETYNTKPACLEPSSPYATGASKCFWTPETSECALVEPDSDVKIILFVAIFSAILATPLALLIDWLIMNVLSAPTREVRKDTSVAALEDNDMSSSLSVVPSGSSRTPPNIVSAPGNIHQRKRTSLSGSTLRTSVFGSVLGTGSGNSMEHTATLSAQSDMSKLVEELTAYRATLTAEQRVEFDAIWGLDENGYFCSGDETVSWMKRMLTSCRSAFESDQKSGNTSTSNVAQRVLTDLKRVHVSLLTETAVAAELMRTDMEKGKRLLFLFQCDLLPGISGKILDSKGSRDNLAVKHVSWETKAVAWGFIGVLNVGMLFYVLLFALTQTVHRQSAWALSFVMWLVVEILFVSSATVLFTHVFIPSLIMKDVNKIKLKLVESIRAFNSGVRSRNRAGDSAKGPEHFNAAEYLFVSTRLAKEWPDLREAQIIALFRTPWPKQSYQRETDVSQSYSKKYVQLYRSATIVAIFFLTNLLQIPPAFQDMVIQMCTTAAVGYTVLLHMELYFVFPALVIIPCIIIGAAVYALVQYNAKRARRRLEQTFPVIEADEAEKDVENGNDNEEDSGFAAAQQDDAVIAKAALNFEQTGELHLPVMDVKSSTPLAAATTTVGHKTRKQSVVQGLKVLNVLQETHNSTAATAGVTTDLNIVEDGSECSESESDDEAKQDEQDDGQFYYLGEDGPDLRNEGQSNSDQDEEEGEEGNEDEDREAHETWPLAASVHNACSSYSGWDGAGASDLEYSLHQQQQLQQHVLTSEPSTRLRTSVSTYSLTPSEEAALDWPELTDSAHIDGATESGAEEAKRMEEDIGVSTEGEGKEDYEEEVGYDSDDIFDLENLSDESSDRAPVRLNVLDRIAECESFDESSVVL